jgi:hypothetical protein
MEDGLLPNGKEALVRDLKIIEDMAAEMGDYLVSTQLFWPKIDHKLVQPTIGGFWVRQHRLQVLKGTLLDAAGQERLDQTIQLFEEACTKQSRHFEQKVSRELEARVRQWAEDLDELLADEPPSMAYYRSDVEVRAIIDAMLDHLDSLPTEAKVSVLREIGRLDHQLEKRWAAGEFIWPAGWEAAYPRQRYWWLYGQLK